MKRSSPARIPACLSVSLGRRLNSYALAASAAGVGVLVLAEPAEGKIVYTPAHVKIGYNSEYNLDINHDGITDFIFSNSYSCGYPGCFYNLAAVPLGKNAVNATGSIHLARALHAGAQIGPHRSFTNIGGLLVAAFYGSQGGGFVSGNWIDVRNRYLALRLDAGGEIHYGWARLSVTVLRGSTLHITATLTGYAYETIANKPIIAGKTKGPDDDSINASEASLTTPTPEPPTLGALAMGTPGLSIWRRQERAHGTR